MNYTGSESQEYTGTEKQMYRGNKIPTLGTLVPEDYNGPFKNFDGTIIEPVAAPEEMPAEEEAPSDEIVSDEVVTESTDPVVPVIPEEKEPETTPQETAPSIENILEGSVASEEIPVTDGATEKVPSTGIFGKIFNN